MAHVRTLASDAFEGRRTGEAGNAMAADYIERRFKAYGLQPIDSSYRQHFKFHSRFLKQSFEGTNLWGMAEGQVHPDSFLLISAHYDHVGTREGEIYNGADDNASGVGALLELSRYFAQHPARYSLMFVAFDAEELGLRGAKHFTEAPPLPLERILLNVNLDMIGRNAGREIYICGTGHYPKLRPPLAALAEEADSIIVSFGHDGTSDEGGDDWTMASDHGRFHEAGVPFLYIGVEDHKDYHQPSDDFEGIMPDFYARVAELTRRAIEQFAL